LGRDGAPRDIPNRNPGPVPFYGVPRDGGETWVPTAGLLYNISENKLLILYKFIETNLLKRFIRASSSFVVSLILFAEKLEVKFCFCVDYNTLNAIIIKNRYFLLLI